MDYSNTLVNVLILLALGIPGFILKYKNLLDDNASENIVNMTLYISQPAIVLVAFQKVIFEKEILINLLLAFVISLIVMITISLITFISIKPFIKDKINRRFVTFGSTFGNSIFMGFPIINMLMPDQSVVLVYLAVFAVAYNQLSWTLGAFLLSGDKKYISIRKAFINPPTIAALIMLPLFFLNFHLDERVLTGFNFLADMAIPLSMTVFGIRLSEIKFNELFSDLNVYIASSIKLLIGPLLIFLVFRLIPFNNVLKLTLYILFMMPCANNLILFSEKFNVNQEFATKTVLFSTIFSCLTIPLLLLLTF